MGLRAMTATSARKQTYVFLGCAVELILLFALRRINATNQELVTRFAVFAQIPLPSRAKIAVMVCYAPTTTAAMPENALELM